ncbi:MAG TPA: hypothetical protein VEY10_03725 [Flavisolibacter sp.]|jgi:hypothetical protein|nr:hypothetical protein [Flavisolibacter sp.]
MDQPFFVFTHRKVLKVSTQLSDERYRAILAKATNKPIEEIPAFNSAAMLSVIKERSDRLKKVIEGFTALLSTNPNTRKDKYDELDDIGRFIIAANDEPGGNGGIFEMEVPEKLAKHPDFVLTYSGKKIGVEHTRLVSEATIRIYKVVRWVLKQVEESVKDLSYLSKTVNIFINYDLNIIGDVSFKTENLSKKQKIDMGTLIAEFVRSELTGGTVPKPAFIYQIEIAENFDSRVDIELGESFYTEAEFSRQLLERIADKDDKAHNYRKEVTVDRLLWLLIVIDDIASFSNFYMETAFIPEIPSSNFDNILLFEKHEGRIHPIFPQTSRLT